MGRVVVTSRVRQWATQQERNTFEKAMLSMMTDVHRQSQILAPKDTRALVKSGKIERQGNMHYQVRYGGGNVPYARRRHFENFRNPQTLGYLEKAGDNATRDIRRYI